MKNEELKIKEEAQRRYYKEIIIMFFIVLFYKDKCSKKLLCKYVTISS